MDNFFHSPVRIVEYVSEYISNFKKQANMQKNKNTNKAKVAKEGKRTSPENGLKDIFAATWVKIFLVTRISGVLGFFGQMEIETCVLVIFHLVFIFIWKKNKVPTTLIPTIQPTKLNRSFDFTEQRNCASVVIKFVNNPNWFQNVRN